MRKLKLEELGRPDTATYRQSPKCPLHIVLDNIRSMHNVGSILRTADAFLVEKVWLCGITPAPPHRDIRKTALGAEESVTWEKRDDAASLISELRDMGYRIYAAEQTDSGILLPDFHPQQENAVLVLGHEVSGVSDEVLALCDEALEIPQFGTKHSLNVSVAAGILMYALTQVT